MSDVKITHIQDKLLEIAIYFDSYCQKNKIKYYLMGGSALGAMRHKGFIPWDDDIDVFMTYDNYRKFIDSCKTELDTERFFLQEENTEEWPMFFSKLRMNGTTFMEEDTKNRKMHQGFYIDVMCLNAVSNNFLYRYGQYMAARLLSAQTLQDRGYITNSKVKKVGMYLTGFLVKGRVKKTLLNFVRSLNDKDKEYVGHFFGRAKFANTSFPVSYLGKPRYVSFSSSKLPVPEEAEKYLTLRYGDRFMDMPSEKTKSMYPSHSAFVDLNKDYSEYVGKF